MFKYWIGKLALMGASGLLACFIWADDPEQAPGKADAQTVRGTVQSFTKAPMGEVDGAILSDGTTIHWPPHLGDRFTAIIAKGDRVRATGQTETNPEGRTQLEARSLSNLRTNATASNDEAPPPPPPGPKGKKGPKGPKGPGGIAPPPPPPPPAAGPVKTVQGGLEEQVRDLQDQLDQLRQEIQRLKRQP